MSTSCGPSEWLIDLVDYECLNLTHSLACHIGIGGPKPRFGVAKPIVDTILNPKILSIFGIERGGPRSFIHVPKLIVP